MCAQVPDTGSREPGGFQELQNLKISRPRQVRVAHPLAGQRDAGLSIPRGGHAQDHQGGLPQQQREVWRLGRTSVIKHVDSAQVSCH